MSKPKNLNHSSKRQFLLQQKALIEKELSEVVELEKRDLMELLESYHIALIENEFAEKTINKYIRNACWFIKNYVTDKPISKQDVIRFKYDIQDKYARTSTINSYITSVNRFLHYCDLDLMKVTKVKEQSSNVLKERLYDHEVKRMRNKAKKHGNMQLYFMIRIMSEMGLRVDERKFITVESVASRHLEIQINNKGKWRTVPVPQELARDLRAYAAKEKIASGMILSIDYESIYNGLKRLAGVCKINKAKVRPHAFRHYFGFKYVEVNGEAAITQLADIMGHGSVETTRIYTRGTSQDYRKAIEKMG